jgi:lipoprotein-anchoring transpeptidase ErfK/SrfK
MDYFSRFDKGIGFHGIPWRKNRSNRLWTPLGVRGVSHGCIRMRDNSARWIYEKAPIGTPVVVQK